MSISTHTLTWSVTVLQTIGMINIRISTHTLTWSVTRRYPISMGLPGNFNSHAHVERDTGQDVFRWWLGDFNSHAHVERDVKRYAMP